MNRHLPNIRSQRGVALFVGLMLLLILTVLGLSSSNVTIMQERMAGNVSEANVAFQEAERTLRSIEQRLVGYVMASSPALSFAPPTWEEADLDRNDCTLSGLESSDLSWLEAPDTGGDFIVVDLSDYVDESDGLTYGSSCRPVTEAGMKTAGEYFLILARATSPTGTAESVVQGIFFWPQ